MATSTSRPHAQIARPRPRRVRRLRISRAPSPATARFTLTVVGSLAHDLLGTWRLISRIDRDASGAAVDEPSLGSDPLALLFFDATGNFAAQFMRRDRSVAVAAPGFIGQNNTTAIGGYDAYFGTYEVDETSGDVQTH